MKTYEVMQPGTAKLGTKPRLIGFLVFAAILFGLKIAGNKLFGIRQTTLEIVFWCGLVSAAGNWVQSRARVPGYTLLANDDSLTGVSRYGQYPSWLATRRTVHRGRVRSIFEIKSGKIDGLGVSEHQSRFAARMMGFVYLPRSIPEFAELQRLVESWRTPESSQADSIRE
ncbi:MAG TPA: hypothetical protein VGJ21_26515 [Terracidiphilus sp.]|jgi:hypothetical protein